MAFNNAGTKATIEKFSDTKLLQKRMEKTQFDLLFLDIKIDKQDGIEFAAEIRKNGDNIDIIFVSSCENRVFEAFSVQPFGFIRKNNFLSDAMENISAYVESKRNKTGSYVLIQMPGTTLSLSIYEILYIEGQRKEQYIYIRGSSAPIVVQNKMETLQEQLKVHGFLRVHKGYLVNYRYIRLIGNNDIELNDNKKIPISRRNVADCREQYLDLMQKSGSVLIT